MYKDHTQTIIVCRQYANVFACNDSGGMNNSEDTSFSSRQDQTFTGIVQPQIPSTVATWVRMIDQWCSKHHSCRPRSQTFTHSYVFARQGSCCNASFYRTRAYNDIGKIVHSSLGITHSCCCNCCGDVVVEMKYLIFIVLAQCSMLGTRM